MTYLDEETVTELARDGKSLPIEETDADPNALFEERLNRLDEVDQVLLTDCTDADGLGCAVLFRHKYGDNVAILPAGYGNWGPDPHTAFSRIGVNIPTGVPVYVTDLGQNKSDANKWIRAVTNVAQTNEVYFRDHHDTPESLRLALGGLYNVEYEHDPNVCATMNVLENDYPEAPEYIRELAEHTNARDLYLTDTQEFKDGEILTNAAFWLPMDEFVAAAVEHGIELHKHEEFGEIVEKRTEIRDKKLDWVMETKVIEEVAGRKVGMVYGDCYHSEAGRRLLEEHGCDVAAIIKPGGKVSWRSTEEHDVAKDLAQELGGGGHPTAAGCSPFGNISIDTTEQKTEFAAEERQYLKETMEEVL